MIYPRRACQCYDVDMKEVLALIATLLIIAAYYPYIRDILRGTTKPHAYSWFISALVTFIACGLQFSDGAGWGTVPTFVAAIAGFIIFGLSLRADNRATITRADTGFFIVTLFAVVLWLGADQPLLSVILIASIDILAFVPTFRKSWHRPDQETISAYTINGLRFTIATLAVQNYTLVTVLYPLSQALVDVFFAIFLVLRRRALKMGSRS